ncbi:tRNA-splicing endonuclease positive effector [Grosmannia clavigera kw1407]|uniref:tRNA-splicing endonuclease positive effector n=1 Tax=Grosmannia clavigera (strain kw1407 / UAMH 11150) TaxID=655863 RepID=F0XJ26_GROCL|nr:tRNA-splicing endonuclease positive effector [Grosmannia clavigera kw1407]EFX02372.1 tRNA-splicing endonuclease positive effector [Grosmannia clavigera kw1407]
MIAAMKTFLDTKTIGGGSAESPDYNYPPVPDTVQDGPELIVRFDSIEQFKDIHKTASLYEENHEAQEVASFNKENNTFRAWTLIAVPSGGDDETWVMLVKAPLDMAAKFPSVGETCHVHVVDPDTGIGSTMWWLARRMSNNFALMSKSKKSWASLLVFNVTLSQKDDDARSVIHALVSDEKDQERTLDSLILNDNNSIHVGFFFSKPSATFDAEMRCLGRLSRAATIPSIANTSNAAPGQVPKKNKIYHNQNQHQPSKPPSSFGKGRFPNRRAIQVKQFAAFKYLLDFRNPAFSVNLFEHFPHMKNPDQFNSGIPTFIMNKYQRLNEHQREAYDGLLFDMPCGLGLLPGGPGGGKTDWAMTVIGLLQSRTTAKVLYLLDINDPLDDATVKYVKMMRGAGLAKRAIRMRTFGTELKRSIRFGPAQNRAQGDGNRDSGQIARLSNIDEPDVDFSKNFLRIYMAQSTEPSQKTNRHREIIVTLDEAAWNHYDENLSDFRKLTELLVANDGNVLENGTLRREIFLLYQTVLQEADFIAATPCVAATAFKDMFFPDLVIFDEAAHARELSTLIAIGSFCPTVGWIFIGDHRQTQPTAKSRQTNPLALQLQTSAMERAYLAGVLKYQLLINHRAYGRLERLPSKLIYDGQMVSGIPHADRFPPCAGFVRNYFRNLSGMNCVVPRLIVHLLQIGHASQVGTSWYHQQHLEWTMQRVLDLVLDKHFRCTGNTAKPGTILLLTPYKAAVAKYKEAIETLAAAHPGFSILERVEARTWDSAQGHEADIVGIDYVREHPTDFMDGMYRFNVGLTRARQGEWHLMHPNMPISHGFRYTRYLRKLYDACKNGREGINEGRVVNLRWSDGKPSTTPDEAVCKHSITLLSQRHELWLWAVRSCSGRATSSAEKGADVVSTPDSTWSTLSAKAVKAAKEGELRDGTVV